MFWLRKAERSTGSDHTLAFRVIALYYRRPKVVIIITCKILFAAVYLTGKGGTVIYRPVVVFGVWGFASGADRWTTVSMCLGPQSQVLAIRYRACDQILGKILTEKVREITPAKFSEKMLCATATLVGPQARYVISGRWERLRHFTGCWTGVWAEFFLPKYREYSW